MYTSMHVPMYIYISRQVHVYTYINIYKFEYTENVSHLYIGPSKILKHFITSVNIWAWCFFIRSTTAKKKSHTFSVAFLYNTCKGSKSESMLNDEEDNIKLTVSSLR